MKESQKSSTKVQGDRFPLHAPILGGMIGALCIYIAAHSPARNAIAAILGLPNRRCYLICGDFSIDAQSLDHISGLALLIAGLLAAWCLTDWLDTAPYERPLVFGLAAFALIVVPAAIIGGIAACAKWTLLRPPLGPLLTAIPAAALLAAAVVWKHWRPHAWNCRVVRTTPVVIMDSLAIGLVSVSAIVSFVHPATGYDALGYHAPLAAFLWRDGNLDAFLNRLPDYWPLAHPGSAEIWFGLLGMVGGERLADLGQLPLALMGSAAIYALSRRMGFAAGAARLGAAAFLMAPIVVAQIGMELNDVAAAALLMTSVALASAPPEQWSLWRYGLVGLGLGMAAATKLAIVPGVLGVLIFLAAGIIRRYPAAPRRCAFGSLAGLIFFAIPVAPWWVRNLNRYGNPVYPAAIPTIGRGILQTQNRKDREFVPLVPAWLLYPVLEPQNEYSGFGALFIVGAVPGLLVAAGRRRGRSVRLYVVLVASMLPAWWTLTRREPRFLLALFGLGFAFLPWSLLAVRRVRRRAGIVVLCMAALFSALVTLDQVLLPFARQTSMRSEFYDRQWNVDPVVAALPEKEALIYSVGYAPSSYPGYYPLLGASRTRLVIPVDTKTSIDGMITKMLRAHVRYVYVPASPENFASVEARFDPSRFEQAYVSTVDIPAIGKTRRYLFRLKRSEAPALL